MKCVTIGLLLLSLQVSGQHDSLIQQATYPKIAKAISAHESNHEKSVLARSHNNIYGFKYGKRAVGKTKGKYSIYKSKEDSVLDYLDFEKKIIDKYKLHTAEKYLLYLSRRYAADKRWIFKIKKLML